jgi:hypothetical protein
MNDDESEERYVQRADLARTRGHYLLPPEIDKILPALGATENDPDAKVIVTFFSIVGSWTWYAFEYDPVDQIFFGVVDGHDKEAGYFALSELDIDRNGLPLIERDCYPSEPKTKRQLCDWL